MRRSFLKPTSAVANASAACAKCQKCLQTGHWTADCTNERVYKARPSRTALLLNPKLRLPEETLVKDDFKEPERPEKKREAVTEQIDVDEFTEQLIAEAKQNVEQLDHEREREAARYEEQHYHESRHRNSPDQYREQSPRRYRESRRSNSPSHRRHRSRSPSEDKPRTRTRSPSRHEEPPKAKEIYHYASDSDFSSDSE